MNDKITKAILAVMDEVKSIDKDSTIGSGNSSYKGVSDKNVKLVIGRAMQKNGLVMLPTSIEPKTEVSRWEEKTSYGLKQKQSVFTEVITKYTLLHESGESIEISGYGHGVDSQDKGAGKATTYAMKYALLYTFLVPTGDIDDADAEHSQTKPVPKQMITKVQKNEIDNLITLKGRTVSEVCKIGKIDSLDELTKDRADNLIKHLEKLPEASLK